MQSNVNRKSQTMNLKYLSNHVVVFQHINARVITYHHFQHILISMKFQLKQITLISLKKHYFHSQTEKVNIPI